MLLLLPSTCCSFGRKVNRKWSQCLAWLTFVSVCCAKRTKCRGVKCHILSYSMCQKNKNVLLPSLVDPLSQFMLAQFFVNSPCPLVPLVLPGCCIVLVGVRLSAWIPSCLICSSATFHCFLFFGCSPLCLAFHLACIVLHLVLWQSSITCCHSATFLVLWLHSHLACSLVILHHVLSFDCLVVWLPCLFDCIW